MARQKIEYSVISRHLTDSIRHELLFSVSKNMFMIPAKRDKINYRLIYYLLPGRYVKFYLWAFAPLNSAVIQIKEVNVNADGIKETVILEYGMFYSELWDILRDSKAPKLLRKFIEMVPKRGNVAYVDDFNVYDIRQCIDNIGRYLEEYLESRRRELWESYDKVL